MTMPPDNCGCSKPSNCYGLGGWHFVVVDERYIADQVRRYEALGRGGGENAGETRREIFYRFKDSAEFWKVLGHTYLGQSIAWEPCPAYRAAVKSKVASRQAQRAQAANRRDLE